MAIEAPGRTPQSPTAPRQISSDDALYLPLPQPLVFAAIYARREGLITGGSDLPPAPEDIANDVARLRWAQAVYGRLYELGAVEGYRAARAAEIAGLARCPAWCNGQHEAVNDGFTGVQHVGVEYRAEISAGVSGLFEFRVALEQYEGTSGEMDPPQLAVTASNDITVVEAADARLIGDIFRRAAASLAAVTSPPVAEPAITR